MRGSSVSKKLQRTGYDYIPSPGEPYHPQGKPDSEVGEQVKVLKEDGASALIEDSNGNTRVVPKG